MSQLLNQPQNSNGQFSQNYSHSNHSFSEPLESSSMIITKHLKRMSKQKQNPIKTAFKFPEDLIVASKINQKQQCKSVTHLKKQCRICLEDQTEGRIINPCKCIGSMSYVHQKCLAQWIKKKVDFKTKVRCQVCDQQFIYKLGKSLSLSCDQLAKNYYKQKQTYKCFIGVMVVLILVWLSLVVLVALASDPTKGQSIRKTFMNDEGTRIVFICVVFAFLAVIIFILLLFFAQYGIHTELIIKNICDYGTILTKKKQIKVYQAS